MLKGLSFILILLFNLEILSQVFIPSAFLGSRRTTFSTIANTSGPQNVSVSQNLALSNAGHSIPCNSTYFSATSSNTTVLSLANITFSGTYPNCVVSFLSAVNTGSSNVTISVKNNYNQIFTSNVFTFTAYQKPTMAFSFRKIVKDYLGSAVRIRRVSDNVELDIGFDGSGNFNLSDYTTFIGGSSATVRTWYDQSGNGYHAQQATTTAQPTITTNGFNGAPQINFNGTYWMATTQVQNVTSLNRDVTVFFAGKATTRAQNNYGAWSDGGGSSRISIHLNWSDNKIYWDSAGGCCTTSRISVANATNVNVAKVYVFGRNNGNQYIKLNGTTIASRADATGTYSAPTGIWYLGSISNAASANSPLAEYVQYTSGLTDAQVDSITNEQKIYFGL